MKKTILIILVLFLVMQLIRPTKNTSNNFTNSITTVVETPKEVEDILKASCYDCHSNTTKYPWYSKIAPISWYVAQHINRGKEYLNFSEWKQYNTHQKKHIVEDLIQEIKEQAMPLKSYLLIHNEAVVTPEQYNTLLNWVKTIKIE